MQEVVAGGKEQHFCWCPLSWTLLVGGKGYRLWFERPPTLVHEMPYVKDPGYCLTSKPYLVIRGPMVGFSWTQAISMPSADVISSSSLDSVWEENTLPYSSWIMPILSVCHVWASHWLLSDHPSCSAPLLQGTGLCGTELAGHTVLVVIPSFSFNVALTIGPVFKA